jgi:hypothetical protein
VNPVVLVVCVVVVAVCAVAAGRPRAARALARHPVLAGALMPSVLSLPLIAALAAGGETRGAVMVAMVYANAVVAFALVVELRPPEK